jgi:hypothetical protein
VTGLTQSGAVADVRVLGSEQVVTTVERVALHGALVALAGRDLGAAPAAWRTWLEEAVPAAR